MTTERENYLYALNNFLESASKLTEAWYQLDNDAANAVCEKYPFCKSFDEVYSDIWEWRYAARYAIAEISEDSSIRFVEFTPCDGMKCFCTFDFDETMKYAEVYGAEYREEENEWYYFCLSGWCDAEKLNDEDYLQKFFESNEDNGFSCGSYPSLEDLIESEDCNGDGTFLLRHFLNR